MRWVVAYDSPCDKRRRKLAVLLEGYGVRVQDSVFECELAADRSRSEAGKMLRKEKIPRTRLLHLDVGRMVAILVKCATLRYKPGKCA